MCEFKTAAVFVKRSEPMTQALEQLLSILKAQNMEVLLEESTAAHIAGARGYTLEELGERADIIIILGGDGTTLGIARRMRRFQLPVIAINAGRLGFITDLTVKDMAEKLPRLLAGDYVTDSRAMLDVKLYRAGEKIFEGTAEIGRAHV